MKNIIKIIVVLGIFSMFLVIPSFAQGPPPPPPEDHGENGNQGPSDAPIGGGLLILIGLSGAYASFNFYQKNKRRLTE